MWVNIIVIRPGGSQYTVVSGYDDGTGGCVSPGVTGVPQGVRSVYMYGGLRSASQLIYQAQFSVQ
jgi:hypothetical protein